MKKNTATKIVFPIYNASGELVTGAAGLDSEVSLDGAAFADCTNEATEIGTTGMYHLTLTAAETNGDVVSIQVKTSTADAKTSVLVFYTAANTLDEYHSSNEYHVGDGGNNDNDGRTYATRFLSVNHALSLCSGGETIRVGKTFEAENILIDGKDNISIIGTPYKSKANRVTITGSNNSITGFFVYDFVRILGSYNRIEKNRIGLEGWTTTGDGCVELKSGSTSNVIRDNTIHVETNTGVVFPDSASPSCTALNEICYNRIYCYTQAYGILIHNPQGGQNHIIGNTLINRLEYSPAEDSAGILTLFGDGGNIVAGNYILNFVDPLLLCDGDGVAGNFIGSQIEAQNSVEEDISATTVNKLVIDAATSELCLYDKEGVNIIKRWPLTDKNGDGVVIGAGVPTSRGVPT